MTKNLQHDKIVIPQKESTTVEFKSSFDLELIESLVAFANANGGTVYLGITNNSNVVGIQSGQESIPSWLNQIKNSTTPSLVPDVSFSKVQNKTIATFNIAEFPIKPVACKGRYLKRVKNCNLQLSPLEVAEMYMHSFNTSRDSYPDPNHGMDTISTDKIKMFVSRISKFRNSTIDLSPEEALKKFELTKDGQPTIAALTVVAQKPTFLLRLMMS